MVHVDQRLAVAGAQATGTLDRYGQLAMLHGRFNRVCYYLSAGSQTTC